MEEIRQKDYYSNIPPSKTNKSLPKHEDSKDYEAVSLPSQIHLQSFTENKTQIFRCEDRSKWLEFILKKLSESYLLNKEYRNVIVFCMANGCRNNLGQWETRRIQVSGNKNGFEFYSAKDMEMVKEADYGFMLWDTKSKGTLQNIINLLKSEKNTLVYISSEQAFLTLNALDDIRYLLAKCDAEYQDMFEKKFKISHMLDKQPVQYEFDLIR